MKKNTLFQTSSQTVGPFFAYGLTAKQYEYDLSYAKEVLISLSRKKLINDEDLKGLDL